MPRRPATSKETQRQPETTDDASGLPAQRAVDPVGPADLDTTAIPRLPRVYAPRTRLWARLDDATAHGITLLVAPVGAGKTLGVGGWLRAGAGDEQTRWIDADATWTASRMNDLLDSPEGTRPLVVIDDAHRLPTATLRHLDDRLNNAPDTLRLLLLSRWDLPLTRLVPELMGQLSILRGDVLRMDDSECGALIKEHARTEHPDVVRAVTGRANGWVAAVVLAARSIAATPDPVAAARRYAEGDASIADQLASEVFAALSPRERHLLLCVANEEIVSVEEAVHLTHDPRAGAVLAELESTGLLVSRFVPPGGSVGSTQYRIHPLLIEMVRRRLVAGGVDVAQAQSTILRAVRLDLARGRTEKAFGRLVAANEPEEAGAVLADEGVTILLHGQGAAIAGFARLHPETVDAHPDSWFVLGLERWIDNDATGAGHWMDRLLTDARHGKGADETLCPRVACARLIRARMGSEPMAAAIGHARKVVLACMRSHAPEPLLPLLVAELGMAQNWLGDLIEAEVNLTTAISLSRARGLTTLTNTSLTHLALALYMQGRESAAIEIANDALERMPVGGSGPDYIRDRALIARDLARLCDVAGSADWGGEPLHTLGAATTLHIGDPVGRFWAKLREARLALMGGSVPAAEQILEVPATWFPMPEHLRVILVIERGFLASLAGDQQALRSWSAELTTLGARGEAALLDGLRHELESDRKGAVAAYTVAEEDATYAQPATRALALTCQAQLLDVMGRHDDAIARLREAATITEVRRNSVPFLGWSRQGTPIESMLERLQQVAPTPWVHELAVAAHGRPDIATVFAPTTATPRERIRASETTVRPSLSAREREVLNELARGATYADIAAELFVSENTVKTHVSSLYGKLAVTRRSEALAVARTQHLL